MTPYNRHVFLLDLCTYSYQLHAQTLIWPLDPYYEQVLDMSTGTHKRRRMKAATLTHFQGQNAYRGPANCQGWSITNDTLDPIIGRYDRLDPWFPAFTRPTAYKERWLFYTAPKCVTTNIRKAFRVEYFAKPYGDSLPQAPASIVALADKTHAVELNYARPAFWSHLPAKDVLCCFEGGTGALSTTNPSWSMMGYVLARWDASAREYDAFVVFRGSRSGTLRPKQSWMHQKGNADWVTDMDSPGIAESPTIAERGSCGVGFSSSMRTMLPTIMTACETITQEMQGKKPRHIYVTGHSLGAGLAVLFSSAMTLGSFAKENRVAKLGWGFGNLILHTYSSPVVGDAKFARVFDAHIQCRRIWLSNDAVTKDIIPKSQHVGWAERIPWHGVLDVSGAHEPINIRQQMIGYLATGDVLREAEVNQLDTGEYRKPWHRFDNCFEMLDRAGSLVDGTPAAAVIHGRLLLPYAAEVAKYFEVLVNSLTLDQGMRDELDIFTSLLKYMTTAVADGNQARAVLHGMLHGELGRTGVSAVRVGSPLLFNFCVLAYYLVSVAKGLPPDASQDQQLRSLLAKI